MITVITLKLNHMIIAHCLPLVFCLTKQNNKTFEKQIDSLKNVYFFKQIKEMICKEGIFSFNWDLSVYKNEFFLDLESSQW